jgi:hypothetical protein
VAFRRPEGGHAYGKNPHLILRMNVYQRIDKAQIFSRIPVKLLNLKQKDVFMGEQSCYGRMKNKCLRES